MQTETTEPALDLAILYRRERAFVRGVLVSLGVAASVLDDAIQDVFVVVFRRLRDYDQRRGTMRAWLFGIAMRVAAKQRRRARPSTTLANVHVDDASIGDPERYVAKLGAAALADRLVSAVPSEQWVPFVMAEVEGMTAPEIADALGVRVATVYTRIHRARQRLERERARMMGDRPSTWWAIVVARLDGWTRPQRFAMAAFVSMRMIVALALVAVVLAAVGVWIARDAQTSAPAEVASTTGSDSAGGRSRSGAERDDAESDVALGPATLAGRVTAPAGPYVGARVCAWPEPSLVMTQVDGPFACTATRAGGRYELGGLRPGHWVVTAHATGWAPASHQPPPPTTALAMRGGERRDGIDIAFVESGAPQRVVVRDLTGGPVEGALVFAASSRPGLPDAWLALPPSVGETDADGVVELSMRAGPTSVRARAEGYADAMRSAVAPGPDIDLVLAPESAIAGRVVSAEDGSAVRGASVTAIVQHDIAPERVALATTDDDGRFRLAGLVPGNYRVQARTGGRYGEAPSAIALGLAERLDDIVIETSSVGMLHARVEFAQTAEPCRSGAVALLVNGSMLADTAAIGPDGEAEFAALVAGTYQPFVLCLTGASRDHYAPVVVKGTEDQSVTWTVDAGASVRGQVLDHDRKPVPRAEVELMGPGATRVAVADDAGAYALLGIAPGSYQVTARRGDLVTSGSAPLVLDAAGAELDLDLELLASARLAGRVVDRNGGPIVGAVVDATRERNGGIGWQEGAGTTDRRGDFAIDLDPGSWTLRASVDTATSEPASVQVAIGKPSSIDLVVDARRGTVRGRVVESDGSPVADAVVVVQAVEDPARGRAVLDALRDNAELVRGRLTLTDDEGRFRMELRAGPHVVLARRRGGGEAWKLGVEIGQDVKLVIPEESAIAGSVRTPEGGAPARMSVRIAAEDLGLRREETFVLGRGRFRFEGMPAGRYVVTARAAEGEGRVEVTLAEGDVRDNLAIALSPGAPRSGRFVDLDTGEPVEGIFAAAGTADDAAQDLAIRAQIAVETGDAKAKSDADGRFTVGAIVGDVVRVVAVPAELVSSPYGVAIAEVPATDGLPDIPLVRLRVGRDDMPGTFGLGLDAERGQICSATMAVVEVSGPAAAAGIRAGDAITAIDGKDVADWRCYLVTQLLTVKPDTTVQLTLARGETVSVVAATRTK